MTVKRAVKSRRVLPRQDRAVQTCDRLLDIAGELLGEVGIERISTNMIAARAGVSPAALYRYFDDKYAVLEALGRRFMERQNRELYAWLDANKAGGLKALGDSVEELIRATARVTESEPGGVWIERAMRAVPRLAHVRVDSHREVTDAMMEVYAPLLPDMKRAVLWRRLRVGVELGYAIDEMLSEEDRIPREAVIREAARILGGAPMKGEK